MQVRDLNDDETRWIEVLPIEKVGEPSEEKLLRQPPSGPDKHVLLSSQPWEVWEEFTTWITIHDKWFFRVDHLEKGFANGSPALQIVGCRCRPTVDGVPVDEHTILVQSEGAS